jgi:peroxiredoxin (alkyl hydroperoxide reductase subunit C)
MITIGQQIPDIQLEYFQNEQFKKAKFSDYRGKWLILMFYPADFTFVCPTELSEAAQKYDEFKKIDAEIISFSTDTVYVHKAWHDSSPVIKSVTYPMGADPTGNISRAFGTYIEADGLSLRGTFIIDPDGILKAIDMHDNSIGRNIEEIFRKLQASQYVRGHKGEVCPASWRPGVKTLRPGVDLVGKI